jgi:hypothetical protein
MTEVRIPAEADVFTSLPLQERVWGHTESLIELVPGVSRPEQEGDLPALSGLEISLLEVCLSKLSELRTVRRRMMGRL